MKNFLVKLKYKALQQSNDESPHGRNNGRIYLSNKSVVCHEFPLIDTKLMNSVSKISSTSLETRCYDALSNVNPGAAGTGAELAMSTGGVGVGVGVMSGSPSSAQQTAVALSATTSLGEYTLPEKNYMQGKCKEKKSPFI